MALLKYEMTCKSEECAKTVLILVDPEELAAPNICTFCGGESVESVDEVSEE
jgi:hypothetical protein